jgi:hypothetical protein
MPQVSVQRTQQIRNPRVVGSSHRGLPLETGRQLRKVTSIDSKGYVGPADWFDAFSSIDLDLLQPRPGDLFGQPGYRFRIASGMGCYSRSRRAAGRPGLIEGGPVAVSVTGAGRGRPFH